MVAKLLLQSLLTLIWLCQQVRQSGASFPACEFPDEWLGEWFMESERAPVTVLKEDFGDKGVCYRQTGNIIVVYNRVSECYRCLIFFDRHFNVLQFREGYCLPLAQDQEDIGSAEEYCANLISSRDPIKTMLKLDGPDISCPFLGNFVLAYGNKGDVLCQNKYSRVDECMTDTQIAFRFERCNRGMRLTGSDLLLPQVFMKNLDDGMEILTCKGMWPADEGGGGGGVGQQVDDPDREQLSYLMGIMKKPFVKSLEQTIFCFLLQPTHGGLGFKIGQSSGASCHGLNKIAHAHRIIHLLPVPEDNPEYSQMEEGNCSFPDWAMTMGPMYSLSFMSKYEFDSDGLRLVLSNYSYISGESHQISMTKCLEIVDEVQDHSVTVLAKVTAGCDTKYKCLKLFQRTEDVLEIQEGQLTTFRSQACSSELMDEQKLPFTTLLKSDPPMRPCSANGMFNVTELFLKGVTDPCTQNAFSQISIRCQQPELIHFVQECSHTKDSIFYCLGGWEEQVSFASLFGPDDDPSYRFGFGSPILSDAESTEALESGNVTLGFLIARPQSTETKSPRRVCFIYSSLNDTSYFWSVYTAACMRQIRPGQDGLFRFNATKLESCGAWRPEKPTWILITAVASLWLSINLYSQSFNP